MGAVRHFRRHFNDTALYFGELRALHRAIDCSKSVLIPILLFLETDSLQEVEQFAADNGVANTCAH